MGILELQQNLFDNLQDSIHLLDEIILDIQGERRYKVVHRKRLQQTKLELEYIYKDLKASLQPQDTDLFRRTLREVVEGEIHKGYKIEPTGFDPETNRYSSRVVKMPIAQLLSQFKEAIFITDKAIRTYPDIPELELIKQDLKALHKEITRFAKEKKLQ
jgi:hypothetical protein